MTSMQRLNQFRAVLGAWIWLQDVCYLAQIDV